ncbi:2-amino-4-hydroxy-6-hydroxymethyldihydropteridine diphosphokinase [Endozoicomonas sp. Mp262]|uniref:2-amino-4-hydroxy-6- hydroxymethyldihydropteridine diphosphokinase n=1 Tax=Endozoicomonas sp. Mp262 TaxID=2919499 RepID=UPI0021D99FDD
MSVTAYIALGSNLEKPGQQLQRAVDEIDSEHCIQLLHCSRLYRSEPVGPSGQPDYVNAVIAIETELAPESLLDTLQAIENRHGRVRTVRWGPRTLDLDILLYSDQIIKTRRLTVPHYQMHLRNFVLYPLNDIAPDLSIPGGNKLSSLLEKNDPDGLDVIAESYPWL